MSVCERFEKNFGQYKNGGLPQAVQTEMAEHVAVCPHCASFTGEFSSLRSLLTGQPEFQPRPGFERRLSEHLRGTTEVYRVPARRRFSSGWAAAGAGLATGLAVGFFVMLAPHTTDNIAVTSAPPLAAVGVNTTRDSLDSISDTAKSEESLYELDQNSRTVSSGR